MPIIVTAERRACSAVRTDRRSKPLNSHRRHGLSVISSASAAQIVTLTTYTERPVFDRAFADRAFARRPEGWPSGLDSSVPEFEINAVTDGVIGGEQVRDDALHRPLLARRF